MQFYYLDPEGNIHAQEILQKKAPGILDVDLSWLSLGHQLFAGRMHSMSCYEKLVHCLPEDHQFAFRHWYEPRTQSTHCLWYSLPKFILKNLPEPEMQVKSFIFGLPNFFPPSCKNQSVLCFVNLPECELVAGYYHGHCLCFKKLPLNTPLNFQHEWHYLQQMYPQWSFDHSVLLTGNSAQENGLIQTHQHTITLNGSQQGLINRIMLYGLH